MDNTIRESLISLETAKLFDKILTELKISLYMVCNTFYDSDGNEQEVRYFEDFETMDNDKYHLRPSQDLISKWLREEWGIVISVSPSFNDVEKFMVTYSYIHESGSFWQRCFTVPLDDNGKPNGTHKNFDTYEEAFEEGIILSLKLGNKKQINEEAM